MYNIFIPVSDYQCKQSYKIFLSYDKAVLAFLLRFIIGFTNNKSSKLLTN